jgi:hypothetical protein
MNLQVPDDFPRDVLPASLSGAQPKLAGRLIEGKFIVGQTDDERYERWDICEGLAQQLVAKARKDAAKYPHHSREVTLQRIRRAIEGKGWVSAVEADWLMKQLRTLLAW